MTLTELRDQLISKFSKAELRSLCFDLGINHEILPDATIDSMAQELVTFCERHGRLSDLVGRCRELRPQENWTDPVVSPISSIEKRKNKPRQGNVFQVSLGDVGAQAQIAIGENIQQSQAPDKSATNIVADILIAIKSDLQGIQRQEAEEAANELQKELNSAEPDLDKLLAFKARLVAFGGKVSIAAHEVFSNTQVQAVLKHAAEIAISAKLKMFTDS